MYVFVHASRHACMDVQCMYTSARKQKRTNHYALEMVFKQTIKL